MKKYDNYKDSGIEWLGEIPEHWESIKLKYIISIQSGKGITNEQFIENGVVVRNRSNQPLCENCLRISIGTKEETEQIIELLKTFNNAEKSIIYR